MRRGAQHAQDRDAHNAQGCAIVRSHAQWKMRGCALGLGGGCWPKEEMVPFRYPFCPDGTSAGAAVPSALASRQYPPPFATPCWPALPAAAH